MDATSSTQLALLWRACLRVVEADGGVRVTTGRTRRSGEADRSWEETVKDLSF